LPKPSREALVFSRLNSVAEELSNRELLSLPLEEREASFNSIRGVTISSSERAKEMLADAKQDAKYKGYDFYPVEFSDNSRDARVKEGDFLYALRNEGDFNDLYHPWYRAAGCDNWNDAITKWGSDIVDTLKRRKLYTLLSITIARLDTLANPPVAILAADKIWGAKDMRSIKTACDLGLLDINSPMVIDPYSKDFFTEDIEKTIRAVGGNKNLKVAA
jgi:hypothetical protein